MIVPARHSLDSYAPGAGKHVDCWLGTGLHMNAEDSLGRVVAHVYLEPMQALNLLAWLKREETTLRTLAQENGGEQS